MVESADHSCSVSVDLIELAGAVGAGADEANTLLLWSSCTFLIKYSLQIGSLKVGSLFQFKNYLAYLIFARDRNRTSWFDEVHRNDL